MRNEGSAIVIGRIISGGLIERTGNYFCFLIWSPLTPSRNKLLIAASFRATERRG